MPVLLAPGLSIPAVHERFDESGALIDDPTKARLVRMFEEFGEWAKSFAK